MGLFAGWVGNSARANGLSKTSELSVVSEDKSMSGTFQNAENPTYYYSVHILKSEI